MTHLRSPGLGHALTACGRPVEPSNGNTAVAGDVVHAVDTAEAVDCLLCTLRPEGLPRAIVLDPPPGEER